jgi:DNA-directed RNA polymerase alpha subunit
VTYNPESLPPTDAVIAAMHPDHPAAVADELHRLLAHCLVRDEEVRRERAAVDTQKVADLSAAVHRWIGRGCLSVRTANVLYNAGHRCMADVWNLRDSDLLRMKNLGRLCLNEIKALRDAIGPVRDSDLAAALARRPSHEEAHLEMINRGAVTRAPC